MFYTKYRPQKFSEMSKPDKAADAIANQVKNKKTAHAYLFVGSRGTGKTTAARILAKALNCEKIDKNGDPCNECDFCIAIRSGTFMDLIEIDAASNRGIDDIRDLRSKINLAPTVGETKVYIIDEVHMLTSEAFNALLKTLEEPPKHAVFILCTTEEHKVPDTIKSRCEIFKFRRATVKQIARKLEVIAKEEGAKIPEEDLEKIAAAAMGGFRDAETMLQQIIEGDLDVNSFIGVSAKQGFVDFVNSLQGRDSNSAIRQVNKVFDDGMDLYVWLAELLKYLRDLLFIAADAYEGLVDVTDDIFSQMEEQAGKFDSTDLVGIIEAFSKAQNELKSSFIPQLPLEVAIVKVCEGREEGGFEKKIPPKDLDDLPQPPASEDKKKKGGPSSKTLRERWGDVVKMSVERNQTVHALLKATRPKQVSNGSVILEVFYKFHKERLETAKNRQVVEGILAAVFGNALSLCCVLSEERPVKNARHESGELTDYNVQPVSKEALPREVTVSSEIPEDASASDVFDGSLPI